MADDVSSPLPPNPVADTFAQIMTGLYAKLQSSAGRAGAETTGCLLCQPWWLSCALVVVTTCMLLKVRAMVGASDKAVNALSARFMAEAAATRVPLTMSYPKHNHRLACLEVLISDRAACVSAVSALYCSSPPPLLLLLPQVIRWALALVQPGVQPCRQQVKWAASKSCWVSE